MHINDLLAVASARGASDLHIKAACLPHVRINGDLVPLAEFDKLKKEDTIMLALGIMNNRQKQAFGENNEVDMAYAVPGLGRFRVNVFQQRGSVSMAARLIPDQIHSFEDLLLPKVLEKISSESRGLILFTGTTGSGKSTSLASMLEFINQRYTRHIVTIEDPIEFLHHDKMSIISQREVGVDSKAFADALRACFRQDPDVILVGEMRDRETIETALVAAETGHLVLSTLHTLDAPETINRIIAVFPPHQHQQIRLQLSTVLRAVVSMRLIKRSDKPGRVPAVEVLIATEFVRHCVNDPERTSMIKAAIAAGTSQYGMQTFDQSLHEHYTKGRVTYDDALMNATNPEEFKLRVQGIYSTTNESLEAMEREMAESDPKGKYRKI
ncbi:MAG: type IV pilus twitching motility protein PilT [Acidobacteria bacterium]|nr:type IV pilus twitching motility protein PilT [Acidobacteriota bacterium]